VQDHLWHTGKRRQFLAPYSRYASIQWQPSMSIEWLCSYLLLSPLSFTVLVFDELALPWYSIASSKVIVAIILTMLLESAFSLRLTWIWSWTSKPSSTQTALPANHLPRAIMRCQMPLSGSVSALSTQNFLHSSSYRSFCSPALGRRSALLLTSEPSAGTSA
jgi:hypothetical protein